MRIRILQAVLILVVGAPLMTRSAPKDNLVVVPPKSVFVDDVKVGRDPFYPNSERRSFTPEAVEVVTAGFPAGLELKGLSGLAGKPLAIINNTTFAEGETGRVKVDGKAFQLECLEIAEGSVKVRVNGQTRELSLSVE